MSPLYAPLYVSLILSLFVAFQDFISRNWTQTGLTIAILLFCFNFSFYINYFVNRLCIDKTIGIVS